MKRGDNKRFQGLLAKPAEQQGSDRNANLGGRNIPVQVTDGTLDHYRCPAAFRRKLVNPCLADGNQRKFRGDKEGICQDQDEYDGEVEQVSEPVKEDAAWSNGNSSIRDGS